MNDKSLKKKRELPNQDYVILFPDRRSLLLDLAILTWSF